MKIGFLDRSEKCAPIYRAVSDRAPDRFPLRALLLPIEILQSDHLQAWKREAQRNLVTAQTAFHSRMSRVIVEARPARVEIANHLPGIPNRFADIGSRVIMQAHGDAMLRCKICESANILANLFHARRNVARTISPVSRLEVSDSQTRRGSEYIARRGILRGS